MAEYKGKVESLAGEKDPQVWKSRLEESKDAAKKRAALDSKLQPGTEGRPLDMYLPSFILEPPHLVHNTYLFSIWNLLRDLSRIVCFEIRIISSAGVGVRLRSDKAELHVHLLLDCPRVPYES